MIGNLASALLAVMLTWTPTFYGGSPPETDTERGERLAMIARVHAEVAVDNTTGFHTADAAALVSAVQGHESGGFEYYVHAGGDSPIGPQDHGLARCLGQIHTWANNPHLPTKADHQALAGLDRAATERCSRATLAYLWGHAQRCIRLRVPSETRWTAPLQDWEAAIVFAAYGKGYCVPVTAKHKARARTFRRIRSEMARIK